MTTFHEHPREFLRRSQTAFLLDPARFIIRVGIQPEVWTSDKHGGRSEELQLAFDLCESVNGLDKALSMSTHTRLSHSYVT